MALPEHFGERRQEIDIERTPVDMMLGYQALSPCTGYAESKTRAFSVSGCL